MIDRVIIPLDSSYEPADDGYYISSEVFFVNFERLLCQTKCLSIEQAVSLPGGMIVAEGGMGKSTYLNALEKIISKTAGLFKAEIIEYRNDPGGLRKDIDKWIADHNDEGCKLTILLDGLDDAPDLSGPIVRLISEMPANIGVWLTTRPICEAERIKEVFQSKGLGLYRLAPLSESDVKQMAGEAGVDSDAFLHAVLSKGFGPLCAKPIGCDLALRSFRENALANQTIWSLWEKGLARMADETSSTSGRSSSAVCFTLNQIMNAASWMALAHACHRGHSIWNGTESQCPDGCISTESMVREGLSLDLLRETLLRGVFTPHGPNLFRFSHALYRDFFCAMGMARYVDEKHWLTLLTTQTRDRICSHFDGVAVFLSCRNCSFRNDLLDLQPELLVKSPDTVSELGAINLTKKLLLRAPLMSYAERNSYDLESSFVSLKAPNLGALLDSTIRDDSSPPESVEMAIEIARRCECVEVSDSLADRALNPNLGIRERRDAAWVLSQIGTDTEKSRLKSLISEDIVQDADDEFLGAVLCCLWPDNMTVGELLSRLHPPKRVNFSGIYELFFLRDRLVPSICKIVDHESIALLLEWAIPYLGKGDSFDVLGSLAQHIFRSAWNASVHPELTPLVARAYYECSINYHCPFPSLTDWHNNEVSADPLTQSFSQDVERRFDVLRSLIVSEDCDLRFLRKIRSLRYPLYTGADLEMLLGIAEDSTDAEAGRWAACVDAVMGVAEMDTFLSRLELLHERFPDVVRAPSLVRQQMDQDRQKSSDAERILNAERCDKRLVAEEQQRTIETAVHHALENPDSAAVCFPQLMTWMFCEYGSDSGDQIDISDSTVWNSLNSESQRRFLSFARAFLDECFQPTSHGLISTLIARVFVALRLFDAETYEQLDRAIWMKYASELLNTMGLSEPDDIGFVLDDFVIKFPEEATSVLLESVERGIQRGSLSVIHYWGERMTNDQAASIVSLLSQNNYGPDDLEFVLRTLFQTGRTNVVRDAVLNIFSGGWNTPSCDSNDGLWRLAFSVCPEHYIGDVLTALENDPSWGRSWVMNVRGMDFKISQTLQACKPMEKARFFAFLHKEFPVPLKTDDETGNVPYRMHDIHLEKNYIINDLRTSGESGCAKALEWLQSVFPRDGWLSECLLEARIRELDNQTEPVSVEYLNKLGPKTSADRWMVRSIQDLEKVVIQAVERYETYLQGDLPAVADLWNTPRGGLITHKCEEAFSDHLCRYLSLVIGKETVINREVQIRPKLYKDGQPGSRTDLWIQAADETGNSLTYCVEVKGSWNTTVRTAMKDQLIDKYLSGGTASGGMLLLGWFACDRCSSKNIWNTIEEAREALCSQAQQYNSQLCPISSFVVDCSLR